MADVLQHHASGSSWGSVHFNPRTNVFKLESTPELDDDVEVKEEITSPRIGYVARRASPSLSDVTDLESTIDLYLNVEVGVVSDIQERDRYLESLAQVKRLVARTERRLARFRMKEVSIIRRLNGVHENLAQKRQLQADLNIDRL